MQEFSGRDYLRIDIANNFGLDKEVWNDRIQWTKDNESTLSNYINDADNKFGYIKAIEAYKNVQKGKPTGHMMFLDACSSFLQIMSIFSGDEEGAKQSNIINTGVRQDFYSNATDDMNSYLANGVVISRKRFKLTSMPVFYNSKALPRDEFGTGTAEYKSFYKALGKLAGGALDIMQELNNHWSPDRDYHQWRLPDGHVSYCPVTKTKEKRIEIDELDHKRFTYQYTEQVTQNKGTSLPANTIQSFDAWIARELEYEAYLLGIELGLIHDAFGFHPNHGNDVRKIFVKVLCKLADSNAYNNVLDDLVPGSKSKYTPLSSNIIKNAEYALA